MKKNNKIKYTYFLNEDMNQNTLKNLYYNFHNKNVKNIDELTIVLNTKGGKPSVAYEIASYLRNYSKKIIGVIPSGVFSSGVILALSFDRLKFGSFGHLAPIDIQTPSYTAGVGYDMESSENIIACYDAVIERGVNAMDEATNKIMKKGKLNIVESIKAASNIIENSMKPILDKIDPHILGEHYRCRDLGALYAYYILVHIKEWEGSRAWELSKFLSRGFPTHGFRIKSKHAKILGLNIDKPTNDELIILDSISFYLDTMENTQGFYDLDNINDMNEKIDYSIKDIA